MQILLRCMGCGFFFAGDININAFCEKAKLFEFEHGYMAMVLNVEEYS